MTEHGTGAVALIQRKVAIVREVLELTQRALLLVDLDGLGPLLERKNTLIQQMEEVDGALAGYEALPEDAAPLVEELAALLEAVVENEGSMEARIAEEQARLREELKAFDRQTRLRHYLEKAKPKGRAVDLKH